MRYLAITLLALASCGITSGGEPEPLSCRASVRHFYSNGCEFLTRDRAVISEHDATYECNSTLADSQKWGGNCPERVELWIACLAEETACDACIIELGRIQACQ